MSVNWKPKGPFPRVQNCFLPEVDRGGTQIRTALDEDTVTRYRQAIDNGDELPPPVIFWDGTTARLAAGFHRVESRLRRNESWLDCEVREGGAREAILFSLESNKANGLPLSWADKRKAVGVLLDDQEWAKWSDFTIAQKIGCSDEFVRKIRKEREAHLPTVGRCAPEKPATKTVSRGGTQYEMKTEGIGKKTPAKPPEVAKPAATKPEEKPAHLPTVGRCATDEPPKTETDPIELALAAASSFDEVIRAVQGMQDTFQVLAELPGGGWIDDARIQELKARRDNLVAVLKDCKPAGRCPHCDGKKCKACRNLGYVPANLLRAAPAKKGA